ncbi:MAG: 4Fe-4S dicluster domain-containing protein [Verrucomicrobia bacterium]|nr:4Fe-4S dicluster domain-containing protein [Verrucomicrobiota bacterium]
MNAAAHAPERFLDEAKSLACIHCGLCLSACPTYLETGNENDSPRGRLYLMRALQAGRLPLGQTVVRHVDLCLGCRACEAACPSGVHYGELLEVTREHVERHHRRSLLQTVLRRVAIEQVFPFPRRLKLALTSARWLRAMRAERWLPRFARETLSLVPEDAQATRLPKVSPAVPGTRRGSVGFLEGCVMSAMFGRTNRATVALLNRVGYDVMTPPTQGCCGALYAHSGNLAQARACARRHIAAFDNLGLDAIITNAAGCGSTMKEYQSLLEHDPAWAERARRFSAKVKDLTEWLGAAGHSSSSNSAPSPSDSRVTYHDACHLAHAQRITQPPRDLIRSVAGDRFVELPESDVCCGSAGTYNLTEPAMAERLQRRKIEHILKTGATVVVTANPGCLLQLHAGLRKAGANQVRVVHLADYLAQTWL